MKVRSFLKMKSLALLPLGFLLPASSALAQTPPATPPPPAAPRSVQFPKPIEKTLANGLRVIVLQRSQMPLVTAQVLIKSGGEVDPSDLAGATLNQDLRGHQRHLRSLQDNHAQSVRQ